MCTWAHRLICFLAALAVCGLLIAGPDTVASAPASQPSSAARPSSQGQTRQAASGTAAHARPDQEPEAASQPSTTPASAAPSSQPKKTRAEQEREEVLEDLELLMLMDMLQDLHLFMEVE